MGEVEGQNGGKLTVERRKCVKGEKTDGERGEIRRGQNPPR